MWYIVAVGVGLAFMAVQIWWYVKRDLPSSRVTVQCGVCLGHGFLQPDNTCPLCHGVGQYEI